MPFGQFFGKISAQPHTIVKQICFPNGNVLFLSLFSLSKNWMHNVVWGCTEILSIFPTEIYLCPPLCFAVWYQYERELPVSNPSLQGLKICYFLLLQLTLSRINCFMSIATNANHSYPTEKISWHYTLLFKSHGEYQKAKEYHEKALLTLDWCQCLLVFSKILNRTIEGTTLAQL